jgi:hypothetical protein
MLMLKQKKTYKMKMSPNLLSEPAELKPYNSPFVNAEDVDVEIVTFSDKPALIIPIDQLRSLVNEADPDFKRNFNRMIDIIASDQMNLNGVIEHYGSKKLQVIK